MITKEYVRTMAAHNRWQNENAYNAADKLSDGERWLDRGAFFKSIHETLSHLLWGDQIWMHRFAGTPKPNAGSIQESMRMITDWTALAKARKSFDEEIIRWSKEFDEKFLAGSLTWYSGAMSREITKPAAMLVVHMFNHQTHHRGQVHAMLTAAGAKTADTDLFAMV